MVSFRVISSIEVSGRDAVKLLGFVLRFRYHNRTYTYS